MKRVLSSNDRRRAASLCAILTLGGSWILTTSSAADPQSPNAVTDMPVVRRNKDLPNFAAVDRGIYRGAAPTAEGLAKLKAMGVKTIIDLRIEKHGQTEETRTAQALGLDRIRIPLGREAPTKKQVALFLATVKDPARQPVFVHCQYGADRTGAMIGIYRVTQEGWTFDRTWAEMRKFGFKPYLGELKAAVRDRAAAR